MLAFTNSNPGPLAPADPPVVKAATAQAVAMGQIAKTLLFAFITFGALMLAGHAQAKARVTCTPGFLGCPPVHAAPLPPVPSPVGPAQPKDIFSGLLQLQGQVVEDLQQADTTQAAVLNPTTGAAWDPFSHMCLAGTAAFGTVGQAGYIPASPGLIAWVQGLAPMAVSSVPPLPENPSAATLAVHARLLVMAAEGDANSLLNQINSGGVPVSLRIACGALINDGVNQVATIAGQAAAFEALLAQVRDAVSRCGEEVTDWKAFLDTYHESRIRAALDVLCESIVQHDADGDQHFENAIRVSQQACMRACAILKDEPYASFQNGPNCAPLLTETAFRFLRGAVASRILLTLCIVARRR